MSPNFRRTPFLVFTGLVTLLTVSVGVGGVAVADGSAPLTGLTIGALAPEGGVALTDSSGKALSDAISRLWVTANLRLRQEYTQNLMDFDRSLEGDESEFTTARVRFGVGADLSSDASMFVEFQNNSLFGDDGDFGVTTDAASIDDDGVKVYQAYVEVRNVHGKDLSIKAGRQELVYGSEMLLGDADFGSGLVHDGVKIGIGSGDMTIHAWWTKEVDAANTAGATPAGSPDEDSDMIGLYCMHGDLDFYWIFNNDDRFGVEDKRHTLGTRFEHELSDKLAMSVEAAWQGGDTIVGSNTDARISAWAGELNFLLAASDKLTVEFGYGYASGDSDNTDSSARTFVPLYQDNHPRYGVSDIITLTNLHTAGLEANMATSDKCSLGVGYHMYWAAESDDMASPIGGLTGPSGGSRFVGTELNLFCNKKLTDNVDAQFAWAHFFPEGYVRNAAGSVDVGDRLYFHLTAGF